MLVHRFVIGMSSSYYFWAALGRSWALLAVFEALEPDWVDPISLDAYPNSRGLRSKDPLGSQGAFRVPLLQTWGLDEASSDLHCAVPMETCKVATCIVYEAATICLTVLVLVQDRFLDPKLLRASGGSGRPIRARSVFLQMLLLS